MGVPAEVSSEQIIEEMRQLKDLFQRRLLDDKIKQRIIDGLVQQVDGLRLEPLFRDIILLLDRIESSEPDDFALSVMEELLDISARYGLTQIPFQTEFDPTQHKAVTVASLTDSPEVVPMAYVRQGYRLNGIVIRPAELAVACRGDTEECHA
jgi:molecular chaperone GrpE